MSKMTADRHPEPEELQRCADGELDRARDAGLVAHVESCAACRAEVEQIRRVTAALCLTSAPPADLWERIKARRDAGERVVLPVPRVEGPRNDVRPIRASPAAPVAATHLARPAANARGPHRWRASAWAHGPFGVAATALLAVRLAFVEEPARDIRVPVPVITPAPTEPAGQDPRGPVSAPPRGSAPTTPLTPRPADAPTRGPGRLRGAGASPESSAARDPAGDSARAARADSTRRSAASEPGPLFTLRETREGLVIVLAAASRSLDPRQALAVDSAVSALKQDPDRRARIRYVDPSSDHQSDSWHLAVRVSDHLEFAGIARERILRSRVQAVGKAGLPSRLEAVEVVVTRPRNQ